MTTNPEKDQRTSPSFIREKTKEKRETNFIRERN